MSDLSDELTNDLLSRGYAAMTDSEAAASLNDVFDRPRPADPSAILDYMMKTEFRNATIYGRVGVVAGLQPDPASAGFGNAPTGASAAAVAIDVRMVAAAKALLRLTADQGGTISTPLTNTELTNILTEMDTSNSQVMSIAQRDAIIAFSENQQSRAQELGLGLVKDFQVEAARL